MRADTFFSEKEPCNAKETAQTCSLTWEILPWLRSLTSLPILLKGILTAEDERLALSYGVAGIIVFIDFPSFRAAARQLSLTKAADQARIVPV